MNSFFGATVVYDVISMVPEQVPQARVSEQQCCLEMANSQASQSFAYLEVSKRVIIFIAWSRI